MQECGCRSGSRRCGPGSVVLVQDAPAGDRVGHAAAAQCVPVQHRIVRQHRLAGPGFRGLGKSRHRHIGANLDNRLHLRAVNGQNRVAQIRRCDVRNVRGRAPAQPVGGGNLNPAVGEKTRDRFVAKLKIRRDKADAPDAAKCLEGRQDGVSAQDDLGAARGFRKTPMLRSR